MFCRRTRSCTRYQLVKGEQTVCSQSVGGPDRAGQERKRDRRIVAALDREARRARPALEKSMLSRSSRGGVPVFSRPHSTPNDYNDSASSRDGGSPARPDGPLFAADVHQAVQERPRRDDQGAAAVRVAIFHRKTGDAPVLDEETAGPADQPLDVRLGVELSPHPPAVDRLVRLGARRPHRGAAAAVQQLELNARRVDRPSHQSAERVDLADEMSFRRATDRRIARHVRDGLARQRAEPDARAKPRRGMRRLAPRMPGADHDHVELCHIFNAETAEYADTESREDVREQIVRRAAAGDFFERRARVLQIREHEFLRQRSAVGTRRRRVRARARRERARPARCAGRWSSPADRAAVRRRARAIRAPKRVEPRAGRRRNLHGIRRRCHAADRSHLFATISLLYSVV